MENVKLAREIFVRASLGTTSLRLHPTFSRPSSRERVLALSSLELLTAGHSRHGVHL